MFKSQHNRNWRYFWRKIKFRHNLTDVLSKEWAADLPDFYMVIEKINNLCKDFNPMNFLDDELYFEKLVRMAKKLNKKKKERRQKRHKKFFLDSKTITLVVFFLFFYPLN